MGNPTASTGPKRTIPGEHDDAAKTRAAGLRRAPVLVHNADRVAREPKSDLFDDIAKTTLPVDFRGEQILFEAHAFEDDSSSYQAMALVHRAPDVSDDVAPLVRVHSGCVTGDIFHSLRCDCYAQLQLAIEKVIESDLGIIVYLPHHEGRGIGLVKKLQAYAEQDRGLDTVDANIAVGAPIDSRDYRLPANMLRYLGHEKIRLMTNNPAKVSRLTEHGIEVVEQVRSITPPSQHNARYLDTKRDRMDHKL
ncbi:MAG: GTP cyclohydrolase II [Pseudomonadota bacterium]